MQFIAYFLFAFIFGSFLEYWVHRLMHQSTTFGTKITAHYGHHRSNTTKGFFKDWLDFALIALLILPAFLISIPVGLVSILGTMTFAAFASYAHQIQHYHPEKCFWMKAPIHFLHHEHINGIATLVWLLTGGIIFLVLINLQNNWLLRKKN